MRPALRVAAAGLAALLLAPLPAAGRSPEPGDADVLAPLAALSAPDGRTTLVSERFGGGFPGGGSGDPSISANGRWVAFASGSADLVRGDRNGAIDVFVRDRNAGTTVRLPAPGGKPVPSGGRATQPSISDDGSVVAFTYQAPEVSTALAVIKPGTIVVAWDRRTGTVDIVSRNLRGSAAEDSTGPSVSGDGRYVAYTSSNSLIVTPDQPDSPDVFRYDRETGRTILVSAGPKGEATSGEDGRPSISDDGNLVAFVSTAARSLVGAPIPGSQVFVRDVNAGRTELVSGAGASGSEQPSGDADAPSISGDGRYVAFESAADNLVGGDGNRAPDVFRRDRETGAIELVSATPQGAPAAGGSIQPSISRDGRMVAFISAAPDLVAGLASAHLALAVRGPTDVYIRDLTAGDTVLVSVRTDGRPAGARSVTPSTNGDGRYVAFASDSDRLVRRDRNKMPDVFLRDLPPKPVLNPPVVDFGARAVGAGSVPGAATLVNAGWGPLAVSGATVTGKAKAEFKVALDGCAGVVLHAGAACTVTVTFSPARSGTRTATLQIADNYTGSPRTARLQGSGMKGSLEVDPPVGPPGIVVAARGSGFPPGAQVRLRWSRGITPELPVVTADATGRFETQVLVFHHDVIGSRELVAEPAGSAPFPAASAEMLVSMPSSIPPGFAALYRIVDLPLVLVIRG